MNSQYNQRAARILFACIILVLLVGLILPVAALFNTSGIVKIPFIQASTAIPHDRYIIFQAVILCACCLLAPWGLRKLNYLVSWIRDRPDQTGRLTVTIVFFVFATTFVWRGHLIVVSKGVPGWAYGAMPSSIKNDVQITPAAGVDLRIFDSAYNREALKYIRRSGLISAEILMLHFIGGEMLPANMGLTSNTWPSAIYRPANGKIANGRLFFDLVKGTFIRRRAGIKKLLPISLSYPNHINYHDIDYRNYPSGDQLVGVSIWRLVVYVDHQKASIEARGAELLGQFDE